jgi:acyl-CoA reductase-like NAD-dependent aldehyde dehydrogenase
MPETRMLINGERVAVNPEHTIQVISPIDGAELGSVSDASPSEVAAAIDAAHAAFETWRTVSGAERSRMLNRLADLIDQHAGDIGRLESRDNGKLFRETTTQARFSARNYRYFAGIADKIEGKTIPLDSWDTFDYTQREPLGVVALITAWNSPMQLLANKLAPALAAGCTAVVKPSELAPLSTLKFGDLVIQAGFPPGVVNIITGGVDTGVALTTDDRLGGISFTGSVRTGQAIARAAAQTLVPVTLELGGKSANIIFDDADLDRAIAGAVAGVFAAGGQTCIAGSRLLVQEGVADEVESRLADISESIRLGDPFDEATQMGPVASASQREKILSVVEDAKQYARLLSGGTSPTDPQLQDGSYVSPTVFTDVSPASPLAQQEVFGPVLAITRFEDEAEAIEIANSTEFGLASGLWTRDLSRAHRVARDLIAGTVWINTYRYSAAQAPFGGVKKSGIGRERGLEAIDAYLRTKNVLVDLSEEAKDPFSLRS